MATLSEDRFTAIYESYFRDVFRVAYSYLRQKEETEDVVQEAFLRFYRKPPKDMEKAKAWLLKVAAVRLSVDLLRKRKKERTAMTALPRTTMEESPSGDDLLTIVSRLPEAYRKPIVLHYYGEENIAEIGRTLHLSTDAVKKRLERGRALIRKELEGQHGSNR